MTRPDTDPLDTVPLDTDRPGPDRSGPGGLAEDARLLRAGLARDPDDARTVLLLADTLGGLGDTRAAIDLYERRAAMHGCPEEVYCALLRSGLLRAASGDWPGAMDSLLRAWEGRPQRLEACYELASRLRLMSRHRAAHTFARSGLERLGEQPAAPGDQLAVQPWVYRWGLLFEYSVAAYWVGDRAGSAAACDRLLALPDLPEAHRRHTVANREFALQPA